MEKGTFKVFWFDWDVEYLSFDSDVEEYPEEWVNLFQYGRNGY